MSISHGFGVVTTLALLVSLAACTGGGFESFEREQQPADEITELGLPDYALETVELGSTRFAGTVDGTDFYIAKGPSESPHCLLFYRSADDWVNACGGGLPVKGGLGSITARLVHEGTPLPEGWTKLGENVQVAP